MRSDPNDYNLLRPKSSEELLEKLSNQPGYWKVFAGGTDLMVSLEMGKLNHKNFLDLSIMESLKRFQESDSTLTIGALCNYSQIQKSAFVQSHFPLLVRSSHLTGAQAIQNRGTLGGNIANASPAADAPPVLLAYEAHLNLLSQRGSRRIPYSAFHQAYKKFDLNPDEIIESVEFSKKIRWSHQYYRKVGTRAYQSISKVAVAITALVENNEMRKINLGLASVGPTPVLFCFSNEDLKELTEVLLKSSSDSAIKSFVESKLASFVHPIDDIRSTRDYRMTVLLNLVCDFLLRLKAKPQPWVYWE